MLQWEKEVNSLKELRDLWKDLDQDAGIRMTVGPENSAKNTIFLFFYNGVYWINLSDGKESYLQFKNFESAENKLMELIKEPFKAWIY